MTSEVLVEIQNSPRDFLQICQRGEVEKLKTLIIRCNGRMDWSIYRHVVSGDTGLHLAAQNGHIDIVKLLCESAKKPECNANVMNFDGKRPLHDAAQFSNVEVLQILIKEGALINTFKRADWTPLMLACTKTGPRAKSCIQALLQAEADPFLRNKDGWTAFLIACRTGDFDIINFFISELGQVCMEDKSKNGRNVLHIIAFHGHLDLINLLVPKCIHLLNASDSTGSTPLQESVKNENSEVTKKLIELGSDVQATNHIGQTILHSAAVVGNWEVVVYVLSNKLLDAECRDKQGMTPLVAALRNKSEKVVEILRKYCAEKCL